MCESAITISLCTEEYSTPGMFDHTKRSLSVRVKNTSRDITNDFFMKANTIKNLLQYLDVFRRKKLFFFRMNSKYGKLFLHFTCSLSGQSGERVRVARMKRRLPVFETLLFCQLTFGSDAGSQIMV